MVSARRARVRCQRSLSLCEKSLRVNRRRLTFLLQSLVPNEHANILKKRTDASLLLQLFEKVKWHRHFSIRPHAPFRSVTIHQALFMSDSEKWYYLVIIGQFDRTFSQQVSRLLKEKAKRDKQRSRDHRFSAPYWYSCAHNERQVSETTKALRITLQSVYHNLIDSSFIC